MDIHVVVYHDDGLNQAHETQPPKSVHHLPALSGILFLDRHYDQVGERALSGHVDVHDLGQDHSHQRQEDPLGHLAHVEVLHGRATHDGGRIDRFLAVGDAGYVEDRVRVFHGVVAGVIAKGAFVSLFAWCYIPFQHNLSLGGHHQIVGLGLDQFHTLFAEEPSHCHLIHVGRQGRGAGPDGGRVAAKRDSNVQLLQSEFVAHAVMVCPYLMGLPVHAGGLLVVDLHPVGAVVLDARLRVLGDNERKGYERAAVQGPAFQYRELIKINIIGLNNQFLAGSAVHGLGLERPQVHQLSKGA